MYSRGLKIKKNKTLAKSMKVVRNEDIAAYIDNILISEYVDEPELNISKYSDQFDEDNIKF